MVAFKPQTIVDYTTVASPSATQKTLLAAFESNAAYDQSVVQTLEQYVDEQIQTATVDVDANLALLKLYLVYPEAANVDKIQKVLLKAITALPSSFFLGAAAIVPESFREDATVKQILDAGFLLHACRFEEFWQLDLAFAGAVADFADAVRAYVLTVVEKTHSSISSAVLQAKLNVSDVKDIVAAKKWTLEGDVVQVPANDDNQMRPKKIRENIEFDDVLKAIHTLSR
ncbi:hypothetical protein Poli38472_005866 [Pythium oligandrum]|uniref:Eukaryotic translation initiation factor 3 subunit K n=1 Tax=Pythium oligandrum TaxID=41045 RepID=A0A8K1FSB9_PYTOL|nr:hypothetical protein Poli38472_005866 [Pythium oligandrum]|eukprot:TMW68398.1 hypothetical protein Poli38472_005866 [Pythium oligandrum]